jgi:hypothetical protein
MRAGGLRLVSIGIAAAPVEHAGEIHMAYRGQRRFPPALGTQSSDPIRRGNGQSEARLRAGIPD